MGRRIKERHADIGTEENGGGGGGGVREEERLCFA